MSCNELIFSENEEINTLQHLEIILIVETHSSS